MKRRSGFAMLEVIVIFTVLMAVSASLLASASAAHRRAVNEVSKEEARDVAVSAVRLMAKGVMEGDPAVERLVSEDGMEPWETEILVSLEDGSGESSFPVTVWSEWEGGCLVLYASAVRGDWEKTVSVTLFKDGDVATPGSAPVGEKGWRIVEYNIEEGGKGRE